MLLKVVCFVICILHWSSEDTAEMARTSRATETKLSILIDHFESLSRISNGISLKIGLLDGSFPPADVIVELLHLGPTKLQNILDLQKSDAESAINQFDTLPKTLETTPEVINIEDRLVLLEDSKKYRMENYPNFPGRPDYEQHLQEVIKLKEIPAKMSRLKNDVGIWKGFITYFNDWSQGMDDSTAVDAFGKFSDILKYLVAIENMPKNFKTYSDQVKTAKLIKQKSKFIDQLENESESRKKLYASIKYTDESLNTIKTELKNTLDISEIVKKSRSVFQTIAQLIRPQSFLYKYSPGFPKGGMDLAKLANDVSNEWILKHVSNGTLVTENLSNLFTEMDKLRTHLEKVEASWAPVREKSVQVDPIISLLIDLTTINGDLGTISNGADTLIMCDKENSAYTNADLANLKPVLDDINKLNEKLDGISDFNYVSQFEDLSLLKKALESRNPPPATDAEKAKVARDVVKEMISIPTFSKTLSLLEDFSEDLKTFETLITESTALANQIKFTDIDDYHTTTKGYMKIYECIGKVGENGGKLRNLIQLIKEIRLLKLPSENVSPMVNLILNSQGDLSKLQDYLKNMNNPEASISLKESFPNFEEVSHNLGIAVQGLVAVKRAAGAKSELQSLLNMALDPKKLDKLQELKTLAVVYKEIDSFLSFLDGVDGLRMKRQAAADFKSDQQVFVEAQKISSWKVDMEKFRIEVGAVSGNHKAALDKLEHLDLEFSKFKFSQAVSSLAALDGLFTLFSTKLMLQPLVAPPNVETLPQDDSDMELQVIFGPDELADSPLAWIGDYAALKIIGAILLFVIIVASVVVFSIFHFCPHCWGFCGNVDNDDPENPVENEQSKNLITPKLTVTPVNEENGVPPKPETKNKEETTKDKSKRTENKNSGEGKNKELVPGKEKPKEDKAAIKKVTDKTGAEEKTAKEKAPEKPKEVKPADEKKKYGPPKRRKPEEKDRSVPTRNCQALRRKPIPDEGGLVSKREQRSAPRSLKRKTPVPQLVPNLRAPDGQLDNETVFNGVISQCVMISSKCSDSRKWPNECISDLIGTWGQMEAKGLHSYFVISNPTQRIDTRRGCLKESMIPLVGYLDDFINGSQIKLPGSEKMWNVAQNPLDGTEIEIWRDGNLVIEKEKISTMEKFFSAVWQQEIVAVVRFTPFERDGKKVCGRWHKDKVGESMEFGQWKVETVKKERGVKSFKNATYFTEYKLKLTDLKTQESKFVTVILFPWNNPRDTRDSLDIIKYLDNTPGNVMMLDRTGLGPSCVIMAIKCGIQLSLTVKVTSLSEFVLPIRKWRLGAIRTPEEVFYMLMSITQGLMDIRNVEFARAYHTYEFFYDRTLEGKYIRDRKRKGLAGTDTYNDGLKLEKHVEEKFEKFEEDKRRREMRMEKQSREDRTDEDVEEQQGEVWEVRGDRDDGNNVANGNQGLGNEEP